MTKREIRYNLFTDTGEQVRLRYRWTFIIVNEPREIDRIKERIYREMAPVSDLNEIGEDLIPGTSGLHYRIFSFSSEKGEIGNKEKIYKSDKFKQDRDLRETNLENLEAYLKREIFS